MNWTDLLQTHGYWMLALGCLLEGETLLVLAGFAAHGGLLDPFAVVGIAAAAGFAGDQIYFWLGRRHGAALLARWPSLAGRAYRVNALVERWRDWLIVGLRFAYGFRIAGPLLMGMFTVPPWRFALLNAVGAILWSLAVAGLGWLFGAAAQALFGEIRHLEGRLLLALALSLAVVWLFRWRRRARRCRSPEADAR